MKPEAIVAIILAVTVAGFVLSSSTLRILLNRPIDQNTVEAALHWKEIIIFLVGALAAYMSGKGPPDDK